MALALPAAVICAVCTGFLASGSSMPDTLGVASAVACSAPQTFEAAAQAAQGAPTLAGVAAVYFGGLKVVAIPGVLVCGHAE